MKEKIAFVCPRSPREYYAGIENYVLNMSKEIKDQFEVEIYCTSKNPLKNAVLDGINILEFKETTLPFGIHFYSKDLIDALKKSNAKIIQACGYNTMSPLMALQAKKKKQKLIIFLGSSKSSSHVRNALEKIYIQLIKHFSKKIDCFIAISNFEKDEFKKNFKETDFYLIPVAHDRSVLKPVKRKQKQIITLGRLNKIKGFHYVIDAFNEVIKIDPEFRLIIVGDGPYRKKLEKKADALGIRDKIRFTGMIQRENYSRLLNFLNESTVFVYLSSYEPQAIIVEEAIYAKIPSILTNSTALREFVECNLAVGVKQKESKKIAEKIIEISKNPKKFAPKEKDIKNCHLMKDWTEVGNETIKVYKKLLKKN